MKQRHLIQQLDIQLPSLEQPIEVDWDNPDQCQFWVKRDDLIHPYISGNKWRKLCGALTALDTQETPHLISFGGGFSNHLHALGYVCHTLNYRFTAMIRGQYQQNPTPMLTDLARWGAEIMYVDKATYRLRHDPSYLDALHQRFPAAVIIPEGGTSLQAIEGMAALKQELCREYDVLVAPVASGGTLAGLITHQCAKKVIGIGVLKGEGYLHGLVDSLVCPNDTVWHIEEDFHHGGYARNSEALTEFLSNSGITPNIPMEPVYSGKLFFAARQLCRSGKFGKNARVLLLHTGGLQGARKTQRGQVE